MSGDPTPAAGAPADATEPSGAEPAGGAPTPVGGAAPARQPTGGDRARLLGLDGLRGVAASLIVVHHAANVSGAQRSAPFTQLAAVADVGVAVFFVLSGFVIYRPFAAAHADGARVPEAVSFWGVVPFGCCPPTGLPCLACGRWGSTRSTRSARSPPTPP